MRRLLSLLPSDVARVRGGGERCAFELDKWFRTLAPELDVVAVGASSDPGAHALPHGWLNAIGRGDTPPPVADSLSTRRVLGQLMRADLVVAHQWRTRATAASRLIRSVRPRMRVVALDHGGASGPGTKLDRWPLPPVDVAAVQSRFEQRVTPMRGRRTEMVRGGVATDIFSPPASDERGCDFLMVARFEPHKGQLLLLDALPDGARVRLMGPSASSHPEYRDSVLSRAAELGVEVAVDRPDAEIVRAYQGAKFTVQVPVRPSDPRAAPPELLGLTVLEAMACASVPVTADAGPGTEFVRDGETGLTYGAESVASLAEALRRAIELDPSERRRLAAAARAESERWSWEAAARAILVSFGVALRP